jgi:hypothetical protein
MTWFAAIFIFMDLSALWLILWLFDNEDQKPPPRQQIDNVFATALRRMERVAHEKRR